MITIIFRCNHSRRSQGPLMLLLAVGMELAVSRCACGQSTNTGASAQDLMRQGQSLQNLGTADSVIKARDKFLQAFDAFQLANDLDGQAFALNDIGGTYDLLGQKRQALEYFENAFSLAQKANDQQGQIMTLHNIGSAYDALGQKQKALDAYGKSQTLAEKAKDYRGQALNFNNLGTMYASWGETTAALQSYQNALGLADMFKDPGLKATTEFNIGQAYAALGNEERGMDWFQKALDLVQGTRPNLEAAALTAIGQLYDGLGDKPKALEYFQKALPLRAAAGDPNGVALTLNSVCKLQSDSGQRQPAEECWKHVLDLVSRLKNSAGEASVRGNLGLLYDRAGQKDEAMVQYTKALAIAQQIGNRPAEITLLNNIGRVYDSQGKKREALQNYDKALPLARVAGNKSAEAGLLLNRAGIERDQGSLKTAQDDLEAAVAIVESTRTKVAEQDLRASYLASVHGYFELYIDVLMRSHAQETALEANERGRALGLLEMLTEARADIRQGVSGALLDRERELQQLLDAKADRLSRIDDAVSDEKAQTLKQDISKLHDNYEKVEAEIRASSPHYASLTQPRTLKFGQIRQLLDANTLLLEYSLGSERSYLWAVGPDGVSSYVLPARHIIEEQARDLYAKLTQRHPVSRADMQAVTAQLSQTALGQVAPLLGRKRLVIVPDGALSYIPFGVLTASTKNPPPQTQAPLVVDHEIVYLPSASALALLRSTYQSRAAAPQLIAIMADPVFSHSDERLRKQDTEGASFNKPQTLTQKISMNQLRISVQDVGANADGSFRRLQHSREEADHIAALAVGNDVLESLDFSATKEAVMTGKLDQYRMIHFATHGLLDSEQPEISGIVLSLVDQDGAQQDGFLRLQDLFNLNLHADLAVLSGCETGMGKNMLGEGIVGLTRGLMYSGVPRVVVSLWKVDDGSTAELMRKFYEEMLQKHRSPAEALRSAQISMWEEPLDSRWSAPYFWATFTLQGDWR